MLIFSIRSIPATPITRKEPNSNNLPSVHICRIFVATTGAWDCYPCGRAALRCFVIALHGADDIIVHWFICRIHSRLTLFVDDNAAVDNNAPAIDIEIYLVLRFADIELPTPALDGFAGIGIHSHRSIQSAA